jgi:hypothetical protein
MAMPADTAYASILTALDEEGQRHVWHLLAGEVKYLGTMDDIEAGRDPEHTRSFTLSVAPCGEPQ